MHIHVYQRHGLPRHFSRWAQVGLSFSLLFAPDLPAQPDAPASMKEFVGSQACEECHELIYARWKSTLMANVLQDVKAKPEVILGDFSKPNPLVTFEKEDIVFTYGSKWKQRFIVEKEGTLYIFYINRRRLLRAPRTVGRSKRRLAELLCSGRQGVVDVALPCRSDAAPHRSAV